MAFDFLRKQDASFWESLPQPERFVLKPRTSGFADYNCIDICSGNIVIFDEDIFGSEIYLSTDEKYIMKTFKNVIKIFDAGTLLAVREIALPEDHSLGWGKDIAFHPKETLMVTASVFGDEDFMFNIQLTVWNYESGVSIASITIEDYNDYNDDIVRFSKNGDRVILNDEFQWDFTAGSLDKLESPINQTPYNKIENKGFFVVATENLPLQQVIDKTRISLGNRKLTVEEQSTYHLD